MKPEAAPPRHSPLAGPAQWLAQDDIFREFVLTQVAPHRLIVTNNGLSVALVEGPIPDDLLADDQLLAVPVTAKELEAIRLAREHAVVLGPPITPLQLRLCLQAAITHLEMKQELNNAILMNAQFRREIDALQEIGLALSAEHDIATLLGMILERSRNLVSADAGSLYVVEEAEAPEGQPKPKQLRFSVAQNDSIQVPYAQFVMPITKSSIAGYVAATGQTLNLPDVYRLPAGSEFGFNRSFDEKFGYRSMSMLTVPMKNRDDEVIGVLQLINRKRNKSDKLTSALKTEQAIIPFDAMSQNLTEAVASQAAVALTNATLYDEIQTLFEGFVHASVMAIESRDPTTSGHSNRVALLTTGLAEVVDRAEESPFRELRFSREQLKEIEYASLLHDFGKVGVREQVLVKANKLYEPNLDQLVQRFYFIKKSLEAGFTRRKLEMMIQKSREEALEAFVGIDREMQDRMREIDRYLSIILEANKPNLLPDGDYQEIQRIARMTYEDIFGQPQPYLTPVEARNLSIFKGSLNEEERLEIESHVTHTYKFLRKIPWSTAYRRVPEIAGKHHEKLNGNGYPGRAEAATIPLQTRMMTISDIFDALTASDRPYKKAVPHDRALNILDAEVKDGMLDRDLFRLFVEAKVYERSLGYDGRSFLGYDRLREH